MRGGDSNSTKNLNDLKQDLLSHVLSYNLPTVKKAIQPINTKEQLNRYKQELIDWYKTYFSDEFGDEFATFTDVNDFLEFEKRKLKEYTEKYKNNPNTKGFTSFRQFVAYEKDKKLKTNNMNECPTTRPSIRNLKAYQNYMKRCAGGGKRKTRKSKKSRRITRKRR